MSRLPRYLSMWSTFAMLCGLCIIIASIAYVNLSENMVKQLPLPTYKDHTPCSHSIFRSFYRTFHAFPESGKWHSDPKNTTNEIFEPSICEFTNCDVFNMFKMKGIKNVLFVGDSQGRNSFGAVRKYLASSSGVSCSLVRTFHKNQLFSRGRVNVSAHPTTIQKVSTFQCNQPGYNFTVKMLYIGIYSLSETVNVSGYSNMPTFQCLFVEYIFKYYLHDKYPELVVFFSLFNHLKRELNITKTEFVDHYTPLRNLLQSTLPRTTWVQWLTNPMEFEKARKGTSLKYKGVTYNGHLAGEVMILFSRWLYDVLADVLVTPNSRHLGFFNSADMTASMANRSRDGVHLDNLWYGKWMEYMLETMCHGL